jgi:hypothetical protein
MYKRFNIAKYNDLTLNGAKVRAFIVNVSQKGMMFYYDGEFDAQDITLAFEGMSIEAEALFNDLKHRNIRIIFKEAVSGAQIETLVSSLSTNAIRAYERQLLEKHTAITFGNVAFPVFLINISPKGILLKYDDVFEWRDESFEIAGVKLAARELHHEIVSKTVRVQFTNTINELEYASLLKKIKAPDLDMQQMNLAL